MGKVSTSFKPGQSGNPNGRPKRDWTWSGLLEEVGEQIEPKSKKTFKELVSNRVWIKAANGDMIAVKEIMNRMDGMPEQNVNSTLKGDLSVIIDKHGFKLSGETTDSVDEPSE